MNGDFLAKEAPTNSIRKDPITNSMIIDISLFLGKNSVDGFENNIWEFLMRFREYAARSAAKINATADATKQKKISAFPAIKYGAVVGDYISVSASVEALIPANPVLRESEIKPQLAS